MNEFSQPASTGSTAEDEAATPTVTNYIFLFFLSTETRPVACTESQTDTTSKRVRSCHKRSDAKNVKNGRTNQVPTSEKLQETKRSERDE